MNLITTPQAPLGTPFSSSSTASDVLDGLDLTGKEVIVTGGHGRLGREVSRALAARGAAVTVAARDPQRAAAAVAGIAGLRIEQLNLTDPGSVQDFAQRWLVSGRPLHALINNAGVLPPPPELMRDARGMSWRSPPRTSVTFNSPVRSCRPCARRGARVW